MITLNQARDELQRHLADGPKARHSSVVAHLMRRLAGRRKRNAELWEIVGLCHDIDDKITKNDRSQHGMLAVTWLDKRLPEEALEAIRAYDHRMGVTSVTELAVALKLADALAIADEIVGRDVVLQIGAAAGWQKLSDRLAVDSPYLVPILSELAHRLGFGKQDLADLLKDAPSQ